MALFRYDQTNNKLVPITSEGSVGIPVGAVMAFEAGTTHENWLECNGRDTTGTAEELRTHYPALYTYLGNSNVLPTQFDHSNLSEWENITIPTSAATAITMDYDGELFFVTGAPSGTYVYIYINGISFNFGESGSGSGGNNISTCIPFTKGDVIYVNRGGTARVRYYNQPLYIKATSAGIEVDRSLYATKGYVNDTESYSTTEQPTGGTWIDGKPIYKISKEHTGNFSNSEWTNITLFNDNVTKNIVKLDIVCATTYLRPESLEITNALRLSAVSGSGNGSTVYGAKYAMTVYYTKATD